MAIFRNTADVQAAPGRGSLQKSLVPVLLVLNFLFAGLVVGLTAWVIDHQIDFLQDLATSDDYSSPPSSLNGFDGNAATNFLIAAAFTAGLVALASYIVGLHNVRVWTLPSAAAAQAAAWIAFLLLMPAFALVWKELHLRDRGENLIVLEAFVAALTVTHFIYTLLLY